MLPGVRTRKGIAILILLTIVAGGIVIFCSLPPREPAYEGKPLSFWVAQYRTNVWVTPNEELGNQAETAIRHIGTNATPVLLRMLSTTESPLRIQLTSRIPKHWLASFHVLTVAEYRQQIDRHRVAGANGFAALGTAATPALPALIALLDHKDERVRYLTVFTLRCLGPAARDALPFLIARLDDPEFEIRDDAVMALGTINAEPECVVPILIKFVEKYRGDRDWILCKDAVGSLATFGAQAKPSVPTLVGLLKSDQVNIRSAATNALKKIDPEAAAKAGVQ
jgi:HEAT repeat protein